MIINGSSIERGPFEWWQQCRLKKHQLSKLNLGFVSYTCFFVIVLVPSDPNLELRRMAPAVPIAPCPSEAVDAGVPWPEANETQIWCHCVETKHHGSNEKGNSLDYWRSSNQRPWHQKKPKKHTPACLHPSQGKNTPPYLADPNFKPMKNESKLSCNTDASRSNTTPFCAVQCFNLWISWNAILAEISNQLALRTFLYTYFMQ